MKRLWIAVAIILLLVFGCVGAELSVEHGVDGIMSELELAHAYAGENRIPEAEEQKGRRNAGWRWNRGFRCSCSIRSSIRSARTSRGCPRR